MRGRTEAAAPTPHEGVGGFARALDQKIEELRGAKETLEQLLAHGAGDSLIQSRMIDELRRAENILKWAREKIAKG
jgi:hypothetical protein